MPPAGLGPRLVVLDQLGVLQEPHSPQHERQEQYSAVQEQHSKVATDPDASTEDERYGEYDEVEHKHGNAVIDGGLVHCDERDHGFRIGGEDEVVNPQDDHSGRVRL